MYPALLSVVVVLLSVSWAASGSVAPVTIQQLESRYAAGGDTVFVVNFWATWCRPCVKELPHFVRLEQTYRESRPMRVLLVSVDDPKDREKVAKFLSSRAYTPQACIVTDGNASRWINAVDTSWSGAIPATLFLQHGGTKRRFVESEFTYQALEQTFISFCTDTL